MEIRGEMAKCIGPRCTQESNFPEDFQEHSLERPKPAFRTQQ